MTLPIWTIYDNPLDYPGLFVAREFNYDRATDKVLTDTTLDGLRRKLPPNLTCIKRYPSDNPHIVESWL